METTPTILDKHNYVVWSDRVKSNLDAQNLWSIIESRSKPPKQKDSEVAFIDWNEKNLKALQMIWNSCGDKTFFEIHHIDSAHIAWNTLQEKYSMPSNISTVAINDLNKNNYTEWSNRVKSELNSQDLLSIIESTFGPPGEEAHEVALRDWRDKNFKALKVIWNSCGHEAFQEIATIDLAHIAWITLQNKYSMPSNINTGSNNGLHNKNFMQRNHRVKSELEAKELWSIIESTSDPPKQEDDEAVFKNWRDKNLKALYVIWNSCDWIEFSVIKGIHSAKIAYNTLVTAFGRLHHVETERDLVEAVQSGVWDATKESLKLHPSLLNAKITLQDETALHIAVVARHVHTVQKLVELMPKESLEIQNIFGETALSKASEFNYYWMAECMIRKNKNLTGIESTKKIPLTRAIEFGYKKLSRYLYSVTPKEVLLRDEKVHGAAVCAVAIYCGMLDIALDLIQFHRSLAFVLDKHNRSAVYALACTAQALPNRNRLSFWKRWIYSCMDIKLADATCETRVNIQSGQVWANGSVQAPFHRLLSNLHNLLGLKHLYEMKLAHQHYHEILDHMCEELPNLTEEQRKKSGVYLAIFRAIKEGNFEFVHAIVRRNPGLVWCNDGGGMTIFMAAVKYRQAKIFSLIYRLGIKNSILSLYDNHGNYTLHMAGMLAPSSQLNRLPGPALRMQRELQWFKEVESVTLPTYGSFINKKGLTAKEVFTENHEDLRKEGEKWMKDTATSCTVVGALIATIMFAAAFTVPGGNTQDTGLPIFLNQKLFLLFIISDSLSLFSSSTSLLMFMGILTSRYAEEDFLKSLPTKMIIGLSTLFFSIATMMITFCATILLMLHEQSWTGIPLISLASLPVSLFGLNQFPLLIEMFNSTYGSSIFDEKMEPWF